MSLTHFRLHRAEDGVATLTWDMPGRSVNLITESMMDELEQMIERVAKDQTIQGCILVSGKESLSPGADLAMLQRVAVVFEEARRAQGAAAATQLLFDKTRRLSTIYRALETCGKPWAAAIHGLCLGGAFELALACHYRVLSDSPTTRVGLPEIKVGLFPGAGGTQRVARLMPTAEALQLLLKGDQLKPPLAKRLNLVQAVVPAGEEVAAAAQWIKAGGSAQAPWDNKAFKLPSGAVHSPAGLAVWPMANAIYRRETYDNYPAARAILQSVYEGLQVPIDVALRIESRYFAHILRSAEAQAMIRTLFVSKGELDKGARRPAEMPPSDLRRLGLIGAGFMGASIAYVAALSGLDVVLIDQDLAAAEAGRAQAGRLISEQVAKGRAKAADRDALLARIEPTNAYEALAGCDLVIEAVFEDPAVKAQVIAKASASVGKACILASNTSTLPIEGLAASSGDPGRFLGIHFFSPVEKMPLVEVIRSKATSERALAVALDFVRLIRKTPIVVNDARGFFANRCVGNYLLEGHIMLAEGVPPAMIENAGKMAGMPVGPLALNDEVAIDLVLRILRATRAQLGDAAAIDPRQEQLLVEMVERRQRLGRKNRRGFYDYPDAGPKRLWPCLRELQPLHLEADSLAIGELKERLLIVQANEAARALAEGIVTDPREADVGSILGFGFAPFTGGVLSYIDGMGTKAFVERCRTLAARHGSRFEPCALLDELARDNTTIYERFGRPDRTAA
jgi:3-hydroxyacyl-CoA dehydrogenase/enoyl-CoA hydratase/3-hydroxybutyryl-CoA epimerase